MTEGAVPGGRSEKGRELRLAEAFAEMAHGFLAAQDVEDTLREICRLAVITVKGCDHAGVSIVDERRVHTRVATGVQPETVDRIQAETQQGPCLDAIRDHETLVSNDLSKEQRWPEFTVRVLAESSVRSVLSYRLFARQDTFGALNLYADTPGAFDELSDRVGAIYAAHAALAWANAERQANLRDAAAARDVIGQAMGLLMARENVRSDAAFAMLRRASQRLNVRISLMAQQLVDRHAETVARRADARHEA
jgi:transcriptional regulator with GAF, ATPase, and Fis domain